MATLAERFVYGRPVDSESEYEDVRVARRPLTVLMGRIFLGAILVLSGIMKLVNYEGTVAHMQAAGIPGASALAPIAGVAEILGGAAVIFGLFARLGAMGLLVFMVITTLVFHAFWNYEGAEQTTQTINFMKNLAIMGGLLLLVGHGPSRYSLDASLRRPIEP